jgi:hypothetical protein
MIRHFTTILIVIFVTSIFGFGEEVYSQTNPNHVYVKGYTRKDGTTVKGYYKTAPNSTINDNFSTVGNVNPYTGKAGWISRDNTNNYIYSKAKENCNFLRYNIDQLIEFGKMKSWIVHSNLKTDKFKYDEFVLQDDYRVSNIYGLDLDTYSNNYGNKDEYDIMLFYTTFNFDKYIDSLEINNIKVDDLHSSNILRIVIDSRYNAYYNPLIENIEESSNSERIQEPVYNRDLNTVINYYMFENKAMILYYQMERYSVIEIYVPNTEVINKFNYRYSNN